MVLVATPHNGSDLANLAKAVGLLLRTNPQLGDMTLHNAHLLTLAQTFLAQRALLGTPDRALKLYESEQSGLGRANVPQSLGDLLRSAGAGAGAGAVPACARSVRLRGADRAGSGLIAPY